MFGERTSLFPQLNMISLDCVERGGIAESMGEALLDVLLNEAQVWEIQR